MDADGGETGRNPVHPVAQLPPAHLSRASSSSSRHIDDGSRIIVASLVEPVPERREERILRPRARQCIRCARRGRGRVRESIDVVAQPGQHGVGIGAVLGDEMASALKSVHIGMGKSLDEVIEVEVAEDRIAWTPEHKRRNIELRNSRGDPLEFAEALVLRIGRDIGHESADTLATVRRAVRRAIRILHC